MAEEKRIPVKVNITKKRRITLDKMGNIIEEENLDPEAIKEARAKKLGLK